LQIHAGAGRAKRRRTSINLLIIEEAILS